MDEINHKSALELVELTRTKQLSPVEVVTASLERQDAVEPLINAFVCTTPEMALAAASKAEARILAGDGLPLDGLPLSVKDGTAQTLVDI